MAYSRRNLIVGLISWLVCVTAVAAQTASSAARQVSFTVFSAQPVTQLAYRPRPGAVPVALDFYPTARSPQYTYNGPPALQIIESGTGSVVAEVMLPAGIRKALFIFSEVESAPTRGVRYRVQVMDDSMQRHEAGTLLILNFSGLPLAGTLNGRPVILRKGFNEPMRVGDSAAIELRTPFKTRSYQAYAETLSAGKSGRALLLLLPPYRRGSLEVQSRVLLDAPAPEDRETRR